MQTLLYTVGVLHVLAVHSYSFLHLLYIVGVLHVYPTGHVKRYKELHILFIIRLCTIENELNGMADLI